ncbi:MAG: glycoside hydrolase N-terminal domain-containing protein [Clostridia bacterium]|nr:glycoside hydrolase N-terminal domain-containing protein [Clostridia bacterium]
MNRHIYTLKKPASCYGEMWRDALPLGNGLTGVLIPGAAACESIHFNRHDLWHGGGENSAVPDVSDAFRAMRKFIDDGDYASANRDNLRAALAEKGYKAGCEVPYPLGWLDFEFVPEKMFSHYRRGVNMRTGEAFVQFTVDGCRYSRQAFVSRDSDITVFRMSADRPFTMTYSFRLFSEAEDSIVSENSIRRVSKDGDTAANVLFLGSFTSQVHGSALEVTGQDYLVLVRCSSHGSALSLDAFAAETYDSLLAKHTALHTPLYDAVTIEFAPEEDFARSNEEMLDEAYEDTASPALLERIWRFGRYLFISAAAENGNPVPLYGLWHGRDGLGWSQYVANENVEMTYWHTMAGGLSYAIPSLIRYYTSKTEKFRECAKNLFGMNGIWISAYTTPNRAGAGVPVSVIANWISCAGWLCRHFWEYYLYTGDEKMLREEILPFMYEAALFYRDYAVEDGDKIRLYPSVSPENTPGSCLKLATKSASGHPCPAVQNAVMDFAVMKELITNLLRGIEITGMYADEAASFRALCEKIPAYMINEDGAVKEWMHPELTDNYAHRHLSHIYPIFPGTEVTAFNNPDLFEAFRKAVHLRKLGSQSGWSLTHMASIYARLGEGEKVIECLDIMAKSVLLNSLLTLHNDWRKMGMTLNWENSAVVQLDAAFGAVNAMQEMLFCWQEEALSVFPALPARLSSGSAHGLVFPGGTIDIVWNADKSVTVTVHASKNISTALLLHGKKQTQIILTAGESTVWTGSYAD